MSGRPSKSAVSAVLLLSMLAGAARADGPPGPPVDAVVVSRPSGTNEVIADALAICSRTPPTQEDPLVAKLCADVERVLVDPAGNPR